jgi:hypothetical protein
MPKTKNAICAQRHSRLPEATYAAAGGHSLYLFQLFFQISASLYPNNML